jgi:hypothetical protein
MWVQHTYSNDQRAYNEAGYGVLDQVRRSRSQQSRRGAHAVVIVGRLERLAADINMISCRRHARNTHYTIVACCDSLSAGKEDWHTGFAAAVPSKVRADLTPGALAGVRHVPLQLPSPTSPGSVDHQHHLARISPSLHAFALVVSIAGNGSACDDGSCSLSRS